MLVHDYSGHPFQVELSVELAARGHEVVHSWCSAYLSGKGSLSDPAGRVRFEPVGVGESIDKLAFATRLLQELRFGRQVAQQARRFRPDVVLVANAPIPVLVVLVLHLLVRRTPWVLWHQDVQGVAARSFAGSKLGRGFVVVGWLMARLERWCARRAARVVVIADGFVAVHEEWGTADKVSVVPNWAPLGEIVPTPRANAWSDEHGLTGRQTLLYSGTLGLKHRPELLVELTRRVRDRGTDAELVVVTEGTATEVLRRAAEDREVPIHQDSFQPFERLSEVLGSGDVLVVILDQSAGRFSVPSKTLSYLCAGRPVLGLMPVENPAAVLVEEAGGRVLPAVDASLGPAADWLVAVLADPELAAELGTRSRVLAEKEFALATSADRFELILKEAARG